MAITARTWVEGEVATASKFNTLRDDVLELDAVAGFFNAQYGTVTISGGATQGTATITAVSDRAFLMFLGFRTDATEAQLPGAAPTLTKANSTTVQANRAATNGITIVTFCITDPRG